MVDFINPSDIINIAYQVSGLDSITITKFNKQDQVGNVSVIKALDNQYLFANTITVNI